jgi:hypothetical protein
MTLKRINMSGENSTVNESGSRRMRQREKPSSAVFTLKFQLALCISYLQVAIPSLLVKLPTFRLFRDALFNM